ncbi:MAG: acetate/propionate family kinase [Acidiferrobacterales bacterium]
MNGDIVVLNTGSSSIKFSLFRGDQDLTLLGHGQIEGIGGKGRFRAFNRAGEPLVDEVIGDRRDGLRHDQATATLIEWGQQREATGHVTAVGHRVVHGGSRFVAPVRVDDRVLGQLEELIPLAPLHQSHTLAAIRAVGSIRPDLPQVACFGSAFHRTHPAVAQLFALPRELTETGVRRYGFHGLSYEYIASVLPEVIGSDADGRVVVAHLGNGASLCALRERKSVDSTMGFTALDGLPMGTRCGALDPGVLLYLIEERGMDVSEVTDLLYHKSGLLGVSGISNDMRTLLASDDPRAAEAINLFVYRIGRELGAMAAALGGLDALVFTAGIGEHAAPIRARVCHDAKWLGIRLDERANNQGGPRISRDDSVVSAWVIPTNEELMIARHTRALLS